MGRGHIVAHHQDHKARPMCFRCKRTFASADDLNVHMLLPANQMCEPVASNPEDGITPEIKFLLALRKQGSRIDTWEGLWRVLFPHDDKIPSSGESPAMFRPNLPTNYKEILNTLWSILSYEHLLRRNFQGYWLPNSKWSLESR